DLEEMHGLRLRVIVFAVLNAAPRPHELDFTGPNHAAAARAVFVLEGSLENVRQDFHVPMAVRAEALSGLDPVVVQHAQRAKAHVTGVVIVAERERVPAVEPAPLSLSSLCRASNVKHCHSS